MSFRSDDTPVGRVVNVTIIDTKDHPWWKRLALRLWRGPSWRTIGSYQLESDEEDADGSNEEPDEW